MTAQPGQGELLLLGGLILCVILSFLLNNRIVMLTLFVAIYCMIFAAGAEAIWNIAAPFRHKFTENIVFFLASFLGLVVSRKIIVSLWPDIVVLGVIRRKEAVFMARLQYGLLHLCVPVASSIIIGAISLGWYSGTFDLPPPDLFKSIGKIVLSLW